MWPGTRLEGMPLTLRKIERYAVRDATPDQPSAVGVPDSQLDWDEHE